MLDLKTTLLAVVAACVLGALGSWYLTAEYKDASWTASIEKQKVKAAEELQTATDRAISAERRQKELADQLEVKHVESERELDKALSTNRRLARELGGLRDPGNMGPSLSEAALMLELRDIVARKLQALGHDVITDGAKGENWALARAIKLITGRVSIELHTNASTSPTARGVEVISLSKDKALAQRVASNIARTLNTVTRREAGWLDPLEVKRDRGFYPGFVRSGGLIVETFFQSNPNELANYHGSSWLVAQAIVDALTIKV